MLHSESELSWLKPRLLVTLGSSTVMIIGLVMLPLDSGPKLTVVKWIACWSGFPGGSSSSGEFCILPYHSCHVYRTWKGIYVGGRGCWILKLPSGRQVTKGWHHFYGGSWSLKIPCKNLVRAIDCWRARLDEMLKKWDREMFIFHAIIPALYPFWWKFYWLS